MIHENREDFIKALARAAKTKGFLLPLMEKDYYLTLILSQVHELSENLIFKGGTCLNKIYLEYFRLSEDLDFTLLLPQLNSTRNQRRQSIQPIKNHMEKFIQPFGMKIDNSENPGRNESKQYVFYFLYQSAIRDIESSIKFEISLRFNPLQPPEKHPIQHPFLHPFTGEPLLDRGEVWCLSLNELIAEKLRATATRERIAPRDFYDLDFFLRHQYDLSNKNIIELFQKKLIEDKADPDLKRYRMNLGRTNEEISDMRSRIEAELFDVLTAEERHRFNLDMTLARINLAIKKVQ